jgi:Cu(I)/Ag(I) efflux system membrane fusion protein
MTPPAWLTRAWPPLVSAVTTAALLGGLLSVQRARGGWPFTPAERAAVPSPTARDLPASSANPGPDRVPIEVPSATIQDLGIRLEEVRRESLTETIQAVATIVPDESRISHVHTRVAGWVEQLDVNTTGEMVQAGQPLGRVFSQELLSSQTEYLAARRATAATGITSAVVASGRTRLAVFGMTAEEIAAIEETGEPMRLVAIMAPRSGVVVNRGVTVGTSVDPSTPLLTIADLSQVWVFAEVPEASIPAVRIGTTARLDFPGSGRTPFGARIDFVYPTLTERTRTLRVRFTVPNAQGTLRPGLYGTAAFELAGVPTMTVPRDAVVDTGREQHVFVAAGGSFEPRPVTLGVQLADRVEVRSGLKPGERIVSAGVFLLDSESRLRATGGAGSHAHGTPAEGAKPPATPAAPAAPLPAPASPPPHAGHQQ